MLKLYTRNGSCRRSVGVHELPLCSDIFVGGLTSTNISKCSKSDQCGVIVRKQWMRSGCLSASGPTNAVRLPSCFALLTQEHVMIPVSFLHAKCRSKPSAHFLRILFLRLRNISAMLGRQSFLHSLTFACSGKTPMPTEAFVAKPSCNCVLPGCLFACL